jgi:hypothetical protein
VRIGITWLALMALAWMPRAALAGDAAAVDSTLVPPALPPASARPWQLGLTRPDRLEHGSLSFTLTLGIGGLSQEPVAAAGGVLALGLAKEVRDRRHGGFDAVDLLADLVGVGLGAWAAEAITR